MLEKINYLKRDRKVNKTFIEKLEKVGLEVFYGRYSYWDNQEYVEIGTEKIWLVIEHYNNNNTSLHYRYQNDVIEDIISTINRQYEVQKSNDQLVNDFFEKLNK